MKPTEEQLAAAIIALPIRLRRVFVMAYVERKSYADIAGELGISVRRVEKRLAKALVACQRRIEEEVQQRCGSRS